MLALLSLSGCIKPVLPEIINLPNVLFYEIIMPEQVCPKKSSSRNLIDQAILHPSAKICYYE